MIQPVEDLLFLFINTHSPEPPAATEESAQTFKAPVPCSKVN